VTKPESCRIVYKEASGFQPEPEEQSEHKEYNHAVATPTNSTESRVPRFQHYLREQLPIVSPGLTGLSNINAQSHFKTNSILIRSGSLAIWLRPRNVSLTSRPLMVRVSL